MEKQKTGQEGSADLTNPGAKKLAFHSVNPSNQATATSLGVVRCSMGKKVNTYVGIVSGDLSYERDIYMY